MASLDDIEKILLKLLDQSKKTERAEKDKDNKYENKVANTLDKVSKAFADLGLGTRSGQTGSAGNELIKTGGQLSGSKAVQTLPLPKLTGEALDKKAKQTLNDLQNQILDRKYPNSKGALKRKAEKEAAAETESAAAETEGAAAEGVAAEGAESAATVFGSTGLAGITEGLAGFAAELTAITGPIGVIIGGVALLGGIVYEVVSGFVKLATYLVELPGRVLAWSNSLLKSQEYLKEFSGAMAAIFNNKEIFETFQNIRVGNATAGSANNLEKSYESLSQSLQPLNILVTNIWNEGVSVIVQIMTVLVELFKSYFSDILSCFGNNFKNFRACKCI